jgi:hypothetical protein
MIQSIDDLKNSITILEQLVCKKLKNFDSSNQESILKLENENKMLRQEYQHLKETSQEVINELNNSIQIIDEYFKKQNANS